MTTPPLTLVPEKHEMHARMHARHAAGTNAREGQTLTDSGLGDTMDNVEVKARFISGAQSAGHLATGLTSTISTRQVAGVLSFWRLI